MSHKNALSSTKLHLATDLVEQSPQQVMDIVKFATNPYLKLSIFLSLAVIIQLPSFNRAAQANYLQHVSDSDSNSSWRSQSKISTLLPRIFDLIAAPIKSQAVDSLDDAKTASSSITRLNVKANKLAPVNNNQQFELARAVSTPQSAVKSPQDIYQVQPGDTISKIALTYQVSDTDLIDINQISNSNIIFVDQQLKIPANEVSSDNTDELKAKPTVTISQNIQQQKNPTAKTPDSLRLGEKTTADSSKSNSNSSNSETFDNDPYIANLRREIDLLRAQNQRRATRNTVSASLSNEHNLPKSRLKSERNNLIESKVKLSSPLLKLDLGAELIEEALALALPLPPLPDSTEYLPNAFDGYIWPAQGVLTSGYGWRWGRMHKGIDIAAPVGTPIFAAASGEVIGAGWHSGYGNVIKLEHLDGSITLYAHNSKILVSHGQRVQQGGQIGEMGSTGLSTGSHLHFEIHNSNHQSINPIALLDSK